VFNLTYKEKAMEAIAKVFRNEEVTTMVEYAIMLALIVIAYIISIPYIYSNGNVVINLSGMWSPM
jgi:Flp pilus assembly pilin Flp